ncbi:cytochrome c/c1 heme-lyase [Xylariomycetidae sp. FL0641]|nr:cytochrome c/c1 heme-lyase [Xylariomycetidae sp. FL0641]
MPDPSPQDSCPVDHKAREAWLSQARAAAGQNETTTSNELPPGHPSVPNAADSCPVDHGAREVWLQQARAAEAQNPARGQPQPSSSHATTNSASSWTSWMPSSIPFLSSSSSSSSSPKSSPSPGGGLGTEREVSTIPRTTSSPQDHPSTTAAAAAKTPAANSEQETGADAASGNWVYPSEKMFFEAMRRKGHAARAADMRAVVPIHNAVNERAWAEIRGWEAPWLRGSRCDGPRLHSFSGLSTQLSPRARLNTWLGYQAPFDRHDWVVDRCGTEVEYVIDFYAGRRKGGGGEDKGPLSFYLDVRPKLNSWEGVKMRAYRFVGLA